MNERVKQTFDAVLERFRSDEIPEAVAYAMFPFPIKAVPLYYRYAACYVWVTTITSLGRPIPLNALNISTEV